MAPSESMRFGAQHVFDLAGELPGSFGKKLDAFQQSAGLDQETRNENRGPDKELPLHFHIINTNTAVTIADSTSVGTVSGLVQ